ncbi:MAG: hypothetical protein HQL69_19190 [Magnetococcales bacterium]|nr:hypothetical protein [Magnetococcales bacterium]
MIKRQKNSFSIDDCQPTIALSPLSQENAMSMCFEELEKEQRTALIKLRDSTTYLWAELDKVCRIDGDSVSCYIRIKTLKQIRDELKMLSKSGFFLFKSRGTLFWSRRKVRKLYITKITDDFKTIISTMPRQVID